MVLKKKFSLENKNDIFLIFAQNIDCGYSLENHLAEAVLTSTHNLCFGAKIPSFTIYKWGMRGYTLHGHVFLMDGHDANEKYIIDLLQI